MVCGMDNSISISKELLTSLEGLGFSETVLGDRMGSIRQYRNKNGVHVREYRDKFVIHQDKVDPRVDPIGHLFRDSPETLLAFGPSLLASSRLRGASRTRYASSISFNPLIFLLAFLSFNRVLGRIKRLLF